MKNLEPILRTNIAKVKTKVEQMDVDVIARETGLLRRKERKLTAGNFLLALLALSAGFAPTLERIAGASRLLAGGSYSKQALSKRINQGIDQFLGRIVSCLFADIRERSVVGERLAPFTRVLVHDSTTLKLPGRFYSTFTGNANRTGRKLALMKIQLISDLLDDRVIHLSLSGFTRNDQAASGDILSVARSGDLVLRDLGYFVIENFRQMIERGIFFLSRYHIGTILLDPRSGERIDLHKMLKKHGELDIDVLLGSEAKVPVRLVCRPAPDAVANERRRKAKSDRDKRCAPSKERLFLMGWSIFITNVDRATWSSRDLQPVYRLRWRIEIIFKAWKSHLRITELNVSTESMLRLSVMTKLLFCTMTHAACAVLEAQSPCELNVSLLRIARILADCAILVAAIVLDLSPGTLLSKLLESHAFYERRTDRKNFYQLLGAPFASSTP